MNCCLFNWRTMSRSSFIIMSRRTTSPKLISLRLRRRFAKRGLCRIRIRGQIQFGQQKMRGCRNMRILAFVNQLNAILKQGTRHGAILVLVAMVRVCRAFVARVQYVARKAVEQQGDGSLERIGTVAIVVVGVIVTT